MRRGVLIIALFAALPVSAAAARNLPDADVVALASTTSTGPVVANSVVWGVPRDNTITFESSSGPGQPVTPIPGVTADKPIGIWHLAGEGDALAVDAWEGSPKNGREIVWAKNGLASPFAALIDPVSGHLYGDGFLFAGPFGVVTVETKQQHVMLRDFSGATRAVPLPEGAERGVIAVSGDLLAVPVKRHVVVQNLDGTVVRRIPVPFDSPYSIAIDRDGDVAIATDSGVFWSAPEKPFESVAEAGDQVAVDGHTVAFAQSVSDIWTVRPVVVTMGDDGPKVLFRGPLTGHVETIDVAGSLVAWSTNRCQLLARFPSPVARTLPAGPCVRSEISTNSHHPLEFVKNRARYRIDVTCLTAPDGACDVAFAFYAGPLLMKRRLHLKMSPHPHALQFVFSRRATKLLSKNPYPDSGPVVFATVRDPDGRHYSDYLP